MNFNFKAQMNGLGITYTGKGLCGLPIVDRTHPSAWSKNYQVEDSAIDSVPPFKVTINGEESSCPIYTKYRSTEFSRPECIECTCQFLELNHKQKPYFTYNEDVKYIAAKIEHDRNREEIEKLVGLFTDITKSVADISSPEAYASPFNNKSMTKLLSVLDAISNRTRPGDIGIVSPIT